MDLTHLHPHPHLHRYTAAWHPHWHLWHGCFLNQVQTWQFTVCTSVFLSKQEQCLVLRITGDPRLPRTSWSWTFKYEAWPFNNNKLRHLKIVLLFFLFVKAPCLNDSVRCRVPFMGDRHPLCSLWSPQKQLLNIISGFKKEEWGCGHVAVTPLLCGYSGCVKTQRCRCVCECVWKRELFLHSVLIFLTGPTCLSPLLWCRMFRYFWTWETKSAGMRKLIGKGGDQMEQLSNKIRQKGGAPVLVSTHDCLFLCSQPSCCPVALLCSRPEMEDYWQGGKQTKRQHGAAAHHRRTFL